MIKNGEIALKGLNRNRFEDILVKNIRWRLKDLGAFSIQVLQSTIYVLPKEPEYFDFDEAIDRVEKIFGIAASPGHWW